MREEECSFKGARAEDIHHLWQTKISPPVIEIFSKVGCRTKWDVWSDKSRPFCTSGDQFRWQIFFSPERFSFFKVVSVMFCREYYSLFEKLAITKSEEITNVSGCLKPCHYKKYNFLGEPSPSSFKSEHYIFSLWAVSSKPKWRRRSWSTQCQPWWQSLVEHLVFFLDSLLSLSGTTLAP